VSSDVNISSVLLAVIEMDRTKQKKRYQDMTTAELAEATREFDAPGTIDRTRPMTPAERAEERKARHPGGRPQPTMPEYPPADARGNFPAVQSGRVSIAREVIRRRQMTGLSQKGTRGSSGNSSGDT
jgi:hypothetical protein